MVPLVIRAGVMGSVGVAALGSTVFICSLGELLTVFFVGLGALAGGVGVVSWGLTSECGEQDSDTARVAATVKWKKQARRSIHE